MLNKTQPPNISILLGGQFSLGMALTSRNPLRVLAHPVLVASYTISSFLEFVTAVVSGRAEKQMIRPYTRRIIAVMADKHPFWNIAMRQYIGILMGTYFRSVDTESTVAGRFSIAYPKPTAIWVRGFIDLIPKSFPGIGLPMMALAVRFPSRDREVASAGAQVWRLGYTWHVGLLQRLTVPRALAALRGFLMPYIITYRVLG